MRKIMSREELPQLIGHWRWTFSSEHGWGITDTDLAAAWVYATERGIHVIPGYDGYEFEITKEMVSAVRIANGWPS